MTWSGTGAGEPGRAHPYVAGAGPQRIGPRSGGVAPGCTGFGAGGGLSERRRPLVGELGPGRARPPRGRGSRRVHARGGLEQRTGEGIKVCRMDLQSARIHHVGGTGRPGFTGNGGPAREATLRGPKGLALDREGNVWLADTESPSIRRITPAGILELVVGTGRRGDGPEGPGTVSALARPHGVHIEADGTVLVGDSETHRLRRLRPPAKAR